MPKSMVPNRPSGSRKDNRWQNFANNTTDSPRAMLPKNIGHKPMLVSRNSRRMRIF